MLPDALGCNTEDTRKWCLYGGNAINPGLSSPVQIRPFKPWLPGTPYEYPERCVERSDYPTWQIEDLLYSHDAAQQTLTFNFTNMMNGARSSCSLILNETLTRVDSHATSWSLCHTSETSDTFVKFDADYGILGIKQTWQCHDNNVNNEAP